MALFDYVSLYVCYFVCFFFQSATLYRSWRRGEFIKQLRSEAKTEQCNCARSGFVSPGNTEDS